MPRPERLGSWALLALGLGAAAGALRMRVWADGEPGEGLFPLLAALLLAVCSALSLVIDGGMPTAVARGRRERTLKAAAYAAALIAYGVLFVAAGHIVATLVVFVTLLRVVERLGWTRSAAIAGATALATYVLFERLLRVPLPRGLL